MTRVRSAVKETVLPLGTGQFVHADPRWSENPDIPLNLAMAFAVDGPLDTGALAAAVADLIDRHSAFRTRFARVGGRDVQIVQPSANADFAVESIAGHDDAAVAARVAEIAHRRFDLRVAPLLRTRVLRRDDAHALVVIASHHAVFDGGSRGVLVEELSAGYRLRRAGAAGAPPAPPPPQFCDFTRWDVRARERDRAAWEQRGGAPPPQRWGVADAYREGFVSVEIAGLTQPTLAVLARRRRVSPYLLLLATYASAIAHATEEERVTIVGAASCRWIKASTTETFERTIGCLVNATLLRFDDPRAPLDRLLAQARRAVALSMAHPLCPVWQSMTAAGQWPGLEIAFGEIAADWDLGSGLSVRRVEVPQIQRVTTVDYGGALDVAASLDLALRVTGDGTTGALWFNELVLPSSIAAALVARLRESWAELLAEES